MLIIELKPVIMYIELSKKESISINGGGTGDAGRVYGKVLGYIIGFIKAAIDYKEGFQEGYNNATN